MYRSQEHIQVLSDFADLDTRMFARWPYGTIQTNPQSHG